VANRMENAISQKSDFGYFDVWKATIEERTGVQITPDRERALALLLDRRMKELDSEDIDQYMSDALDVAKGAQEWSGLIERRSGVVLSTVCWLKKPAFFATAHRWIMCALG